MRHTGGQEGRQRTSPNRPRCDKIDCGLRVASQCLIGPGKLGTWQDTFEGQICWKSNLTKTRLKKGKMSQLLQRLVGYWLEHGLTYCEKQLEPFLVVGPLEVRSCTIPLRSQPASLLPNGNPLSRHIAARGTHVRTHQISECNSSVNAARGAAWIEAHCFAMEFREESHTPEL